MSKASEYADRIRASKDEPPPFKRRDKITMAHVTHQGELWLVSGVCTVNEALLLADWIYETFGDK